MKQSKFNYGFSVLLLICISMSSLPLSLLHHHDHKNDCDVSSNIPSKFKKEKDSYPKHYHSHSKECFLCFQSHFSSTNEVKVYTKTILSASDVVFISKNYIPQSLKLIELKGRGPPALLNTLS